MLVPPYCVCIAAVPLTPNHQPVEPVPFPIIAPRVLVVFLITANMLNCSVVMLYWFPKLKNAGVAPKRITGRPLRALATDCMVAEDGVPVKPLVLSLH